MKILLWALMFLVLAIVGSTVAAAGMIGMPIDSSLQTAIVAMAVVVVGSGIALLITTPRAPAPPFAGTSRDTNSFI